MAGKIIFPDGAIYEGKFKQNKLNGARRQILPDGTIREGILQDDKLTKRVPIIKGARS